MKQIEHNPDVLNCLANLSNDEVFTPPALVNQMLDLLPQELFKDPNSTFLDPFCKTGVFLREIVKRLDKGLEDVIPDRQERIDHILHKQVFGMAITELTSLLTRRTLYCSKFANGEHSISHFDAPEGNIWYMPLKHTWEFPQRKVNESDEDYKKRVKCRCCGAPYLLYGRSDESEQYAYPFIHLTDIESIYNMQFSVICGNPPYHLSDGGNSASAMPIYHLFVDKAIKLKPRYLSMIIPSRWFAGGKGLDDFRATMIRDKHIRVLNDYLNSVSCFGSGVEIKSGVCYFLWDRDNEGPCKVTTLIEGQDPSHAERYMQIDDNDIFIRRNESINLLAKVTSKKEPTFDTLVSSRKPFGFPTNIEGHTQKGENDIILYQRGGTAFISIKEVEKNKEWVSKYKIFITKAYNAGDDYPHQILNAPIIGVPNSCCTETYIMIGPFESKEIAENVISYIRTKFFRFMVSLRKISQDATQKVYKFVPMQDFSHPWTDEMLYEKYGITEEEIAFIDSMIRPME